MSAIQNRTVACLVVAGLAAIVLATGPSATATGIFMLSASREACTKARNVAVAIQKAQRCVSDDTIDVLDHLNQPRRVKLTVNGPTETFDYPDVGQTVATNFNGQTEYISHYRGQTSGSMAFGGTNITPNDALLEMHDSLTSIFEADSANLIQLQLHFSGVTYDQTPFVLSLSRLDGEADPMFVAEASVFPADGTLTAQLPVPSAGTYAFSIEWLVPEYVLPSGDSSVGIDSYVIAWQMVPEPAAATILLLGAAAFGVVFPRQRARAPRMASRWAARPKRTSGD